jgi:hypothetical protein
MSNESNKYKIWMYISITIFIALLVSGYFRLRTDHPTLLEIFTFYPILFLSIFASTKLAAERKKRSSEN